MKRLLFSAAALFLIAIPLIAQQPKADSARLEAMKKVLFLVGSWEGDGWILMGKDSTKHHFRQTEDVHTEVSGRIVTIRGRGTVPVEGGEPRLTHDAWAVILYDTEKSQYRIHTYKDGEFLAADMRFAEDGSLIWGFPSRGGTMRFTIRLNDKGQWSEIGEYSPDGEKWFKNFEMTLNKVAKPAPR